MGARFQELFHSPPGVLFTFPSRYWYAIGQTGMLRLTQRSGLIHAGFHEARATWDNTIGRRLTSRYGAGTLYGQAFKPVPLASRFMTPARPVGTGTRDPTTPATQPPTGITRNRFGLIRFRSPLLTEYPFLQVLRCFTSLRTPRRSLRCRPMTAGGLPHSEILGSKPCWRLPEAYRILKRPSSVLSAKASTMRPCGRHSQRPCHPAAFLIARSPDDKSSHCSNDHKTIDLETKLKKKSLAKSR